MNDLSVRKNLAPYKVRNKVRFVTAASLFDGHDASINIMMFASPVLGEIMWIYGQFRATAEQTRVKTPHWCNSYAISAAYGLRQSR